MFHKFDDILFTARIITNVVTGLLIAAGIIGGIVLLNYELTAIGLIVMFGFPISGGLLWVVFRLFINLCCDIKLIRNKLYDEKNDDLEKFIN